MGHEDTTRLGGDGSDPKTYCQWSVQNGPILTSWRPIRPSIGEVTRVNSKFSFAALTAAWAEIT